jgi:hypothetical protein
MKWIAIAGSWRQGAPHLEEDVRATVQDIFRAGNGIVTGGALGVDSIATDEYLRCDPSAARLKIFLPTTLEKYAAHYRKRAHEGVITLAQADGLIGQLEKIRAAQPASILENPVVTDIDKTAYFNRITEIVDVANELIAFQVNASEGTQHTINKARRKGIPVKVWSYKI